MNAKEKRMNRRTLIAIGLAGAVSAGAWTAQAQNTKERHPVLERAITQINSIKGRLQSAPKDFGGHKQKAIDALSLASDELRQAMQFDK
jgi:hypothetical protein